MSFDTKYRPSNFGDVLGQEGTIKILRQFIRLGKARQQSYLFAGPFGSGKTTLGRILARALLCSDPTPEGDPCDKCVSCHSLLTRGTAEGYVEVDAATNSGKDQMRKVIEEIQFSTFSGRHRVYLFDEAHQLSREALDAMLKPLEENVQGTPDKQLVCIFCTTEPEKMRTTILSRCAPAFMVRAVPPDLIAKRLEMVCSKEGITHEPEMLHLIAEITECHIRDALKSLEGIAMLGAINRENVSAYLHLDLNGLYLDILENLGRDLPKVVGALTALLERRSPATCYEKLSDMAMLAYQVGLEAVRPEAYRDTARLKGLVAQQGENLLGMAVRFSERPAKPTAGAIKLDLFQMHARLTAGQIVAPVVSNVPTTAPIVAAPAVSAAPVGAPPAGTFAPAPIVIDQANPASGTLDHAVYGESEFKALEIAKKREPAKAPSFESPGVSEFGVPDFCYLLARRVLELSEGALGSTGRPNVDSP